MPCDAARHAFCGAQRYGRKQKVVVGGELSHMGEVGS